MTIYDQYKLGKFGTVFEAGNDTLLMKDGTAFLVIGKDFINLQESDDYAFGDTALQALRKYQDQKRGTWVRV